MIHFSVLSTNKGKLQLNIKHLKNNFVIKQTNAKNYAQ